MSGLTAMLTVAGIMLSFPITVAAANRTELDTIAQTLLDIAVADGSATGVAAGISYGDGRSWTGAAGWRDSSKRHRLLPTDQFRIGSQTKTYTGTVILQMVDEGAFALSDTLQTLLPAVSVPNADHITLRHLLNMTSGIPDFLNAPSRSDAKKTILTEWNNLDSANGPYGDAAYTPEQLIAQTNLLPRGQLGEMKYSNTNFVILGLIAERASCRLAAGCKSIEDLIRDRIIQPLGLKATEFPTTNQFNSDAYSHGLFPFHGRQLDFTHSDPRVPWSAGAMISTPVDALIWIRAVATNKGDLLSPQLFRKRVTEMVPGSVGDIASNYGLAIYSQPGFGSGTNSLGHSGEISGYTASMFYDPDTDIAYAVNLNAVPAAPPTRFPYYGQTATKESMNFKAPNILATLQRNITLASRQDGTCGDTVTTIPAGPQTTCSGNNFRTTPIMVDGGELAIEPSNKVVDGWIWTSPIKNSPHKWTVPSLAFFGNGITGIAVTDGGTLEVEAGAAIEVHGISATAISLSDGGTARIAGPVTAYGKGSIAIKGTDGDESLVIAAGTRVVGDIDLGSGNDSIQIDGTITGVVRTTGKTSVIGSGDFVTAPR